MRKFICLVVFIGFSLCSCQCQHSNLSQATCTTGEICQNCGESQGEPIGHDWTEATCTTGEICQTCGKSQGEPLDHDWVEATCTLPQTCKRCNEIKGNALGHTVSIGTCDRCHTFQNNELFTLINNKISEADTEVTIALSYINSQSSKYKNDNYKIYLAIIDVNSHFATSKSCLEEVIELCANNSELSTLKKAAQAALRAYPKTPQNSEYNSLNSFLDELKKYVTELATVKTKIIYIK